MLAQRERNNAGFNRRATRQSNKIPRILSCEVATEQMIRSPTGASRAWTAHRSCECRRDNRAALANAGERRRHKASDRSEDDGGVELRRRAFIRTSGPTAPKLARKILSCSITGSRERAHGSPFKARHLCHDMDGGTEAVDACMPCVACHAQRAVTDQAGTEKGSRRDVVVGIGNLEAVIGIRKRSVRRSRHRSDSL